MSPELIEIKRALEHQSALLEENNNLLRKLHRRQTATLVFSIIWYALLVGLPFALYYYVLGPYLDALGFTDGSAYEGLREFPGYQQFESFFGLEGESNNN